MRRIVSALLTVLVVFVVMAGVANATDQSKFDSLIEKYATVDDQFVKFSPKAACVCQEGTFVNFPGILIRNTAGGQFAPSTYCMIPFFDDVTGDLQSATFCAVFVILTK